MSRASASAHSADLALLRIARTRGHTPRLEHAVAQFSRLGEYGAVWYAIGAIGMLGSGRSRWHGATKNVAKAYVLNTTLKMLIRRRRPVLEGLPALVTTPTTLSFPSAHATTSFAAARGFTRAGAPAAPLYALALAMVGSRLYLGVHHPSDVAAGAILGSVIGK